MLLRYTQEFFFKAMREGYAAGAKGTDVPGMPGHKEIPFRDGDFRLLDRYCTVKNSPRSAGTTTIWHKDVTIWVMNYGGLYENGAGQCLKSALLKAYRSEQFIGGRGLFYHPDGIYVYINRPNPASDFRHFGGREEILVAQNGVSVGFHEYSGMSLF